MNPQVQKVLDGIIMRLLPIALEGHNQGRPEDQKKSNVSIFKKDKDEGLGNSRAVNLKVKVNCSSQHGFVKRKLEYLIYVITIYNEMIGSEKMN